MQPEPPPRALRLEIDRHALARNWKSLDALSGSARAGAAVKANAYGLGARQVVPVLREAGCTDFFVAHFSELAEICPLVDPTCVSVLHGPLTRDDVGYARAIGAKPVINTLRQARLWAESGGGVCDLMVDTGINRLGLAMSDLGDEAVRTLSIDILLSHLASADEEAPLNALQLARWNEARGLVSHRRSSLANSAGIVLGDDYHGDLTRPGLSLYGGIPRRELSHAIAQVARPQAALMQIREIAPGDGVGYNSTFVASGPMRIGTVAIGYADGYLRCWSGKGTMRHGETKVPVIGRVSMDMTVVDLSAVPEAQEGDWLELDFSLPEAAAKSGLSQYELLTLLGDRFAR